MLQVLDLLTSQMSGASTLGQMRVARDALMQHEDPNKTHLASSHISLLDAGGVELEVVRAARPPAAGDDARAEPLLLLVHGGLFMSGSPLAVRHVAARLSAELGVAVVTPKLRLAPEHPYPAALDDLKAAYDHLSKYGVDPHRGGRRTLDTSSRAYRLSTLSIRLVLGRDESLRPLLDARRGDVVERAPSRLDL